MSRHPPQADPGRGLDVKKAETGIIYIDEIDKVARKAENPSITRDVSGEGVQQALLEDPRGHLGVGAAAGRRKHPHEEFIQIDTTDVCSSSVVLRRARDIVEQRVGKKSLGFTAEVRGAAEREAEDLLGQVLSRGPHQVRPDPELPIGRLPLIAAVNKLTTRPSSRS